MGAHVLFLDDMEWRHREFDRLAAPRGVNVVHVWSAKQAIAELGRHTFDQVFLDHDLSEQDIMAVVGEPTSVPTGMTVVDHILTMATPPVDVVVHSCNGPAALEMTARLSSHQAGIRVRACPFPTMMMLLRDRD